MAQCSFAHVVRLASPLRNHRIRRAGQHDARIESLGFQDFLRLVYQQYAHDIEAALLEAGFDDIRPAAANVFPFVPPEGITVSELADLARVRKQTMAQAVDQLERTGYVERRPNPNDRRSPQCTTASASMRTMPEWA